MKQTSAEKLMGFYIIWTIALFVLFFALANCRWIVFSVWWISTVVLMLFLLGNILYLAKLRERLLEDRLKEDITERKRRLVRKANRISKYTEEDE